MHLVWLFGVLWGWQLTTWSDWQDTKSFSAPYKEAAGGSVIWFNPFGERFGLALTGGVEDAHTLQSNNSIPLSKEKLLPKSTMVQIQDVHSNAVPNSQPWTSPSPVQWTNKPCKAKWWNGAKAYRTTATHSHAALSLPNWAEREKQDTEANTVFLYIHFENKQHSILEFRWQKSEQEQAKGPKGPDTDWLARERGHRRESCNADQQSFISWPMC